MDSNIPVIETYLNFISAQGYASELYLRGRDLTKTTIGPPAPDGLKLFA